MLFVDGNENRVGIGTATPVTRFQVGDTFYVNDSNNRVGIGTSNPTHKLNVIGSANITGDSWFGSLITSITNVVGNLIVSGNMTTNQYYGEMWNYTGNLSAWEFTITTEDVYYNLTGLRAGELNGFTFTDASQVLGGSYLTAQVAGLYKMDFSISLHSQGQDSLFGMAVVHDFDVETHRDCYARRNIKGNSAGNAGISCLIDLDIGDQVNIQLENEESTRNVFIHTVNLNLMRIGN